jgi:hypothetical protein
MKQETIQCEALTDSGQTVEDSSGIVTQNLQTVHCEVITDNGQSVEGSSGHSDTEPTDGTV